MNPQHSPQRPRPTTFAFVGPHRALVTAASTPPFTYDLGVVTSAPEAVWAFGAVAEPEQRLVFELSGRDSAVFMDALRVEAPNEALRQAVARRVLVGG